jgi:hypothetical protein
MFLRHILLTLNCYMLFSSYFLTDTVKSNYLRVLAVLFRVLWQRDWHNLKIFKCIRAFLHCQRISKKIYFTDLNQNQQYTFS